MRFTKALFGVSPSPFLYVGDYIRKTTIRSEDRRRNNSWAIMDKKKNLLKVQIPKDMSHNTKREVLAKTAKIYDPLSLVSSVTLLAKLHHRDCRDAQLSWDEELTQQIKDKWSS